MSLVRTIDLEITGDFTDPVWVWQRFLDMLNCLEGLTVLATVKHDFPGGGLSGVVIIGESHAAIHTWPEHGRAWVELATCGDPAALPLFAAAVQELFVRREEEPGAEIGGFPPGRRLYQGGGDSGPPHVHTWGHIV